MLRNRLILLCLLLLFGCFKNDTKVLYPSPGSACQLSDSQRSTLWQSVATLPIQVHLDPSWKEDEKRKIIEALEAWNQFASASLAMKLFLVSQSNPLESIDTQSWNHINEFCGSAHGTEDGLFIIPDPSADHWNHQMRLSNNVHGVTVRCFNGDGTHQGLFGVLISSRPYLMQTLNHVVLHELGHVLGLNHSCSESSGSSTNIACRQLPDGHPFLQAVMSPKMELRLIEENGKVRVINELTEDLQQNDVDRAYCLYRSGRG